MDMYMIYIYIIISYQKIVLIYTYHQLNMDVYTLWIIMVGCIFFLGDQFNSGDVTNINVRHGYYGLLSSIP
jgi:hypothetical protein